MSEQLTEQEIKKRNEDIKKAIKTSNKLIKNFNVYIAIYESDSRHQTSHITKAEYDKMQKNKFIGSDHEKVFFNNLPDDDYVDSKTLILNKNNYGMAFHPMIWKVLTLEERITVCRIAWKDIYNRDLKEFCNYNSNGVVMVGKHYKGSLNIGSFFRDDLISSDIIKNIFNGNNSIKHSYYFNRMMAGRKIEKITDYSSFEELQYLSPLEPNEDDISKMKDEPKAFFFDQLYRRRYRAANQKSLELIRLHGEDLLGLYPMFDDYVTQELKNITETNLFIMRVLGSNVKERDKDYLEIKTMMFNESYIQRHNELCDEFEKVKKEQVEVFNKPYKDKFDILQKKADEINEKIKNAQDAIEIYDLEQQLKPIKEDQFKLKNIMAKNHNQITKPIMDEIEKVDSNMVNYEQALEHFKDYFEKQNKLQIQKNIHLQNKQKFSDIETKELN